MQLKWDYRKFNLLLKTTIPLDEIIKPPLLCWHIRLRSESREGAYAQVCMGVFLCKYKRYTGIHERKIENKKNEIILTKPVRMNIFHI
jgi:hypothetical protein